MSIRVKHLFTCKLTYLKLFKCKFSVWKSKISSLVQNFHTRHLGVKFKQDVKSKKFKIQKYRAITYIFEGRIWDFRNPKKIRVKIEDHNWPKKVSKMTRMKINRLFGRLEVKKRPISIDERRLVYTSHNRKILQIFTLGPVWKILAN